MEKEILKIENVSKNFGALKAINDLSFSVFESEIFGIAGPNGSGKSTLFNIISSIPFPSDKGKIFFNNQNITNTKPYKLSGLGIARTFQTETVFDSLTAIENIKIAISQNKKFEERNYLESRSKELLNFVGIEESRNNMISGDLNVFERKKIMIASALALEPKIIMLDEPASGLAKFEVQETIDLIKKINLKKITVLVIEHVLPLLLNVSKRLLILNHGEKLTIGTPDEVVRNQKVIDAYLGEQHE